MENAMLDKLAGQFEAASAGYAETHAIKRDSD